MKQSIRDFIIISLNLKIKLNEYITSSFLSKKTDNFIQNYWILQKWVINNELIYFISLLAQIKQGIKDLLLCSISFKYVDEKDPLKLYIEVI